MCHLAPGDAFVFSVLLSTFKHPLVWGVEKNLNHPLKDLF